MTSDALLVLRFIFKTIWSLFTSFLIPGTRTTPAEWALFSLAFVLGVRVGFNYLDIHNRDDNDED